jgi:hypothetical protein
MTAISFKSKHGDDYLEISENETLDEFIGRLVAGHGNSWIFMNIVLVNSTDFDENEIIDLVKKSQMQC